MRQAAAALALLVFLPGCVDPESIHREDPEAPSPGPSAIAMHDCQGVFGAFLVDMDWAATQVPESQRPQAAAGQEDLAALDQYLMTCGEIVVDGRTTGGGALAFSFIALAQSEPGRGVYYAHDLVVDASPLVFEALSGFSDRLTVGQIEFASTEATLEVMVDSQESGYTLRMGPRAETFAVLPGNDTIVMDHGQYSARHGEERQSHLQASSLVVNEGRLEGATAGGILNGVGQEWRSQYELFPKENATMTGSPSEAAPSQWQ